MHAAEPVTLPLRDVSTQKDAEAALADCLAGDARCPLDLTAGRRLRPTLLRLAEHRHVLVLTVHHIVCAGWAFGTLMADLSEAHRARAAGAAPEFAPAPSFAAHARQQTPPSQDSVAWWRDALQVPPALPDLPLDRKRPLRRDFAGASLSMELPLSLLKAARKAGAKRGCTLFGVLFGAVQIVLSRLSGANDIILGVATGGQALLPDPDLVGHCVNFLPIRVPIAPQATAADHLQKVAETLPEAFERQDVTLGTLVQALDLPRGLDRQPLTEIQFNLERQIGDLDFGGLSVDIRKNPRSATVFDIFFNVVEHKQGLRVELDYNTSLFDSITMERWVRHLAKRLRQWPRMMAFRWPIFPL